MNLAEHAGHYSKLGFTLFQLAEYAKVPRKGSNGCLGATSDQAIIAEWWKDHPESNIGLATNDLWVLDIDGEAGRTSLNNLIMEHGRWPATLIAKTGNGKHYYFRQPLDFTIRNSASKIADGIDTRGVGGYVVMPPSIHPDTRKPYEWVRGHSPTEFPPEAIPQAPEWLLAILRPVVQVAPAMVPTLPQISYNGASGSHYGQAALERECHAIATAPDGQQEHTLNAAALKIGQLVAGGEIKEAVARAALEAAGNSMASYNSRDPWTAKSIASKVERGMRDGMAKPRKAPEARHGASIPFVQGDQIQISGQITHDPETGEIIEQSGPASAGVAPIVPDTYKLLTYNDLIALPPVTWVIDKIFPERSFGVIYGAPKKGKSFVALDMGLCVASGKAWHGHNVQQAPVLYIAGEGVGGLANRIKAWMVHNQQDDGGLPFYVLASKVNMRSKDDLEKLGATVMAMREANGKPFGMIFIDTVARALLGGDENSSTDMGEFVAGCDYIKDLTGAAVIGVHHTGKDEDRGMRGSNALLGAIDTCLLIKREDKTESSLGDKLTVIMQEQKDAEPIEEKTFKMVKIDLEFGDSSLALEITEKPVTYQKTLNRTQRTALDWLYEAINKKPLEINGCIATNFSLWRSECLSRKISTGDDASNERLFRRISADLRGYGYIEMRDDVVWVIKDQEVQDSMIGSEGGFN